MNNINIVVNGNNNSVIVETKNGNYSINRNRKSISLEKEVIVNKVLNLKKYITVEYRGDQKPKSWNFDIWYLFYALGQYAYSLKHFNFIEKEIFIYELMFDTFDLSIKHWKSNSVNEHIPSDVIYHIDAHYGKREYRTKGGHKVGCDIAYEAKIAVENDTGAIVNLRRSGLNIVRKPRIYTKEDKNDIRKAIIEKHGDKRFNPGKDRITGIIIPIVW